MPARAMVISWVPYHGRSAGLALALGARAEWMPWARSGGPRWRTVVGWLRSSVRTLALVGRAPRGSLVVVMCPPVFALVAAVLAARPRGVRVAADLHSAALNVDEWAWSHGLLRWCLRRCQAVLVTNVDLLTGVEVDRPVLVVHDPPLPMDDRGTSPVDVDGPVAVFPTSGAPDEPLDVVVAAAALLHGEVTVVITGRQPGLAGSPHVLLPGFVDDRSYAALLRRADVVLALTTREQTMQRAAYEAIELGRPLVCSDTAVLRAALGPAAVLTAARADDLAEAIRAALRDDDRLLAGGAVVRGQMQAGLAEALSRLQDGRAA